MTRPTGSPLSPAKVLRDAIPIFMADARYQDLRRRTVFMNVRGGWLMAVCPRAAFRSAGRRSRRMPPSFSPRPPSTSLAMRSKASCLRAGMMVRFPLPMREALGRYKESFAELFTLDVTQRHGLMPPGWANDVVAGYDARISPTARIWILTIRPGIIPSCANGILPTRPPMTRPALRVHRPARLVRARYRDHGRQRRHAGTGLGAA